MPYDVALIGLGNIGALYDLEESAEEPPRTHLRAVLANKDFRLRALIDRDPKRIENVKKHIENDKTCILATDLQSLGSVKLDVIVLAVPPEKRLQQLQDLAQCRPSVVVFEKPLAQSFSEAEAIAGFCEEGSIKGLVNFHRRYDPGHQNFKALLPHNPPLKIVVHYSKGLWNYGSHAVDLLIDWFGPIRQAHSVGVSHDHDPLLDGFLWLERGPLVHLIAHKGNFDQFEFEFFYADHKLSLLEGGIRKIRQNIEKNRYHEGYAHLSEGVDIMPASKVFGLQELYRDIAQYCADPRYSLKGCSVEEAAQGIKIIETLIDKAKGEHHAAR